MQTYLFYDIETTGLNKAFDQVLQFAAIRTDLNLRELERYELKVKLNPDIILSPRAMLTHEIGIKEAQTGLAELAALQQIHQWLNHPGTISVGYNSLGFDDEFLRFSFYRNLLPAYTHQFANQCGRMDIYPMTVMYYLFKNTVIKWPQTAQKLSLKLEELNRINQFFSGRSHHAMSDVEITLALARSLMQESQMWHYLSGYFNKPEDQKRSEDVTNNIALMVHGKLGGEYNFLSPVLYLGNHAHYKHQLWLRLDLEALSTTTLETLPTTTWALRKKIGEPGFLLPNKSRYWHKLSLPRQTLAENNYHWLQREKTLLEEIKRHHQQTLYPIFPETDVEASLYLNGFWSREETDFCHNFHPAPPKEKALMTEKLQNPKLKALATRLLGRHYPDDMTLTQKECFTHHLEGIYKNEDTALIDFRGEKKLTVNAARKDIQTIRQTQTLTEKQLTLLQELEAYLDALPLNN